MKGYVRAYPAKVFVPFRVPLFVRPILSVSPLFSREIILYTLHPRGRNLR